SEFGRALIYRFARNDKSGRGQTSNSSNPEVNYMTDNHSSAGDQSRRTFLKTTAAAGALVTAEALAPALYAAGSERIKVGLVGCGGRGTGACDNVLRSAKNVEIVAIGDVFSQQVARCRNHLLKGSANDAEVKGLGNGVDLPDECCFTGLDAYKKVI